MKKEKSILHEKIVFIMESWRHSSHRWVGWGNCHNCLKCCCLSLNWYYLHPFPKRSKKYTEGSFLLLASELIHLYSKPLFLAHETEYSRWDEKESNLLIAELKQQRRMVENALTASIYGPLLVYSWTVHSGQWFFLL